MMKMYAYLKHTWWQALLAMTALLLRIMADLSLPDYMMRIIDQGIYLKDLNMIISIGKDMLMVSILVVLLFFTSNFLASYIGASAGNRIRKDIFNKIESFSLVEFDRFSTASLITRSTNDVQQVQHILTMSFRILLAAPVTGIVALIKAIELTPSLSWIFIVIFPILSVAVILIMTLTSPRFEKVQKLTDKLNLIARESLTGIRVIRAFNAQKTQAHKFQTVNDSVYANNVTLMRIMSLMDPVIMICLSFTTILILWTAADKINAGVMQIGQMMAFMQYTAQVMASFINLTMIFQMFPRAVVSARRIREILDTQPVIVDPLIPTPFDPSKKGEIVFDRVSFRYPHAKEDVLHDITFSAKAGSVTAFIGSTGSGKSTLINLIPRLYDVSSGSIHLEGVDLRQVAQKELRDKIGYVPQKGMLLSGTIQDNLLFGAPEAPNEVLLKAADTAQASKFISEKEDQYHFKLSQNATNLSGGQKQRLSIARALVKEASIYIFDDSFSALDFKTDAALRKALHKEVGNSTLFIVGQRVSTIMHADQIIVLEQGRISGIGKHHDLLKTCPVYFEIASSQLSQEEMI
jgi:ATP-binding cassette, subfamily B, multidrug efflux pump